VEVVHSTPIYVRLFPGLAFPTLGLQLPFKAVLIADVTVPGAWQAAASDWLVQSGCLYLMAWGVDCSSWDDSVDWSNLEMFDFKDIPDEAFVMTTWHEDEPLRDTFWFAKNNASHPAGCFLSTVLVHVGPVERSQELLREFDGVEELEN
jgi:hypothetical protein